MASVHPRPKLSTLLPPVILGGGVYNTQMNPDPSLLPVRSLVARAFELGITAIDTSPYYGPSGILIGDALAHSGRERSKYLLMTKAGRIKELEFDYSPVWIRKSVERSLERLKTSYLDVVFCHDVEFVSRASVIGAVRTLFEMVDEGKIRYVGISGYPPVTLAGLAISVKETLGRPVDVVQSYCHYNLQNEKLAASLPRLKGEAGVDVVINASPLSMKLLSGNFPGDFHPAPRALQEACMAAHRWCQERGETLPEVAMRWVFANWQGQGPTVSGVSYLVELEENVKAFREMSSAKEGTLGKYKDVVVDKSAVERMEPLWKGVREILGEYVNWSWESPPRGWGAGESKLKY